jgi:tetratricopeptide (TPR) repeat protein
MGSPAFVQLASSLVEAMGQRLDAAKPTDEGLVYRTTDGFLYAFLEDPREVSLETIAHLSGSDEPASVRLVVLTPGHLPPLLEQEVAKRGGTVVEGARFAELARQLGLEVYLGEGPRARPASERRLLPSAVQLDDVMHRARTWLEWGVPALALRFYRQAAEMKPGFLPAKVGLGRALLGLGLVDDADRQFDEVLEAKADDVDARLGKASVLGAKAQPKAEVAMYRQLLEEDDARTDVRAHLLAALIDLGEWSGARVELDEMLERTPEDPQLRFLKGVALEKTGHPEPGAREREEARRLGLAYDREVSLCQHLGLPIPARRAETAVAPVHPRPAVPASKPTARATKKPAARAAPSPRKVPAPRASPARKAAPRKRK